MKVVYRHYEAEQGLEEIQAKIFTEVSAIAIAEIQSELELFELILVQRKE